MMNEIGTFVLQSGIIMIVIMVNMMICGMILYGIDQFVFDGKVIPKVKAKIQSLFNL